MTNNDGWRPIAEFDAEADKIRAGGDWKYYEVRSARGHSTIARFAFIDCFPDGDGGTYATYGWQRRKKDAIHGDTLGWDIFEYRPILHAEDHAFQNAGVMFKKELTQIRLEKGGHYTAGEVVFLMDKYFPNWYIKDVGLTGIEMSELQDKLEISFKFEFGQHGETVQKKKSPRADPKIREMLKQIEATVSGEIEKYLHQPDLRMHNAKVEYLNREFKKLCSELVTLHVIQLPDGSRQMRVSRADGARLLESVGWDMLNAMLTKGFVLIEEK